MSYSPFVRLVKLLNADKKDSYISELKADYAQSRETHLQKQLEKPYVSLADSRAQKPTINWEEYTPTKPAFLGTKVFDNFDLEELVPYIDWTPFFQTWELHGKYPAILEDEVVGVEAKKLFKDASNLLQRLIEDQILQAKAVFGLAPAQAVGDDILTQSFPQDWIYLTYIYRPRSSHRVHSARRRHFLNPKKPSVRNSYRLIVFSCLSMIKESKISGNKPEMTTGSSALHPLSGDYVLCKKLNTPLYKTLVTYHGEKEYAERLQQDGR